MVLTRRKKILLVILLLFATLLSVEIYLSSQSWSLFAETADLENKVAKLNNRIAALEQKSLLMDEKVSLDKHRKESLIIEASKLRDTVYSSEDYTLELKVLQSLLGRNAQLDVLEKYSHSYANGTSPTRETLKKSFSEVSVKILSSARAAKINPGIWDRLSVILSPFITVRSKSMDGQNPEAIIARAEKYITNGNIAYAIMEVQSLPPESLLEAKLWLENAKSFVDTRKAADDLLSELAS